MVEISHVIVSDLKESVIACRNAMRLTPPEYTDDEFEKSLQRAIKLVQASKKGEIKCHDNFNVGIRVSFDIKYPNYFTPEFQRYNFIDIVTSSSKMHRLAHMDMDACFNEYVCVGAKEMMKELIAQYDYAKRLGNDEKTYKAFMRLLSNCPLGVELFMRVSTNYKQLQTIYFQRRHHRLQEDWGAVCDIIESLPFAHQLIIGDKPTISDEEFNLEMKKL